LNETATTYTWEETKNAAKEKSKAWELHSLHSYYIILQQKSLTAQISTFTDLPHLLADTDRCY
jgi:hypothetical protein